MAQLKSRSLLQIRAEFARLKQMKCILVTGIVCQQRRLRWRKKWTLCRILRTMGFGAVPTGAVTKWHLRLFYKTLSLPGDIYWCLTDFHHCYGGWMVTTTMPQRRIFPLFAVNRSSLCENFSDYHFNGIGYAHVLQNVFSGMILM